MAGKKEEKTDMAAAEAGHKGGGRAVGSHGHEFYEEAGHKGGEKGGQRVKELIEEGMGAESKGK